MKRFWQNAVGLVTLDRKWLLPLFVSFLVSLILFVAATGSLGASSQKALSSVLSLNPFRDSDDMFVESELIAAARGKFPPPPRLAYVISGSKGDGNRMKRTLRALYHPRNQYVLHLDLESPPKERVDLTRYVKLDATYVQVGNVHLITKANLVTYRGPTMVACTLHAAAILLRKSKDWDWFINLSASDYPLVTQDDLLHVLSYLPRDLNFIDHTSSLGWKEYQRAKPMIIDPGLYMKKKANIFWATQRRPMPTAYKLFTGSAWVVLTRAFIEYCIWGWDNLPRIALMYFTNVVSSPEWYFHTIICNTKEFRNTTVNHDMHYIAWDTPPKQHPLSLTLDYYLNMTTSGAPFARKFAKDDPVLDKIDKELLGRKNGFFTPGGWCMGNDDDGRDPCLVTGDSSVIKPGPGTKKLEQLVLNLLSPKTFRSNQCSLR